jgi:signal transduction histidine kinase
MSLPKIYPASFVDTRDIALDMTLRKPAAEMLSAFQPKHDELASSVEGISGQKPTDEALRMRNEALQREIAERKRVEAAWEEERSLLVRRVEERTAALSVANAELAKASRLKDEFLANISHELRTPLCAILGVCETLKEQIDDHSRDGQLRALADIEENGRHLLSLINDILDLSKIEAGKIELGIGPVLVESVCHASLSAIKHEAGEKRLKVSVSLDRMAPAVAADALRLKQILVNLLSNAVKFTPEGGSIGLEVKGDAERGVAHFAVWDTGIGIAQEDVPRLFQPFVQLDSSLSRQYPGTGLGLVLVHRLVELHGGSVTVESEPGRGSRFTVSLPWQESVGAGLLGETEIVTQTASLQTNKAGRNLRGRDSFFEVIL